MEEGLNHQFRGLLGKLNSNRGDSSQEIDNETETLIHEVWKLPNLLTFHKELLEDALKQLDNNNTSKALTLVGQVLGHYSERNG